MYELKYSEKSLRQLEKFDLTLRDRILKSLERIRIRPYSFIKRIVGSSYFRLRVGDYRIILDIQNKVLIIHIVEVGHRKKIYK
jgi:mRNA interferase RelE/StbE